MYENARFCGGSEHLPANGPEVKIRKVWDWWKGFDILKGLIDVTTAWEE